MKIFLGLTEVSGYYSGLKRGFDLLDVDAKHVSVHAHPFNFGETETKGFFIDWARNCVRRRIKNLNKGFIVRTFWLTMVLASRLPIFIWAAIKFDTFIFGGGSSFFHFKDLPILRMLGKRIIYVFHGTDARPTYVDGFWEGMPSFDLAPEADTTGYPMDINLIDACLNSAKRRKNEVAWIERFAHVIVSYPPYSQFLSRPFVDALILGVPKNKVDANIPAKKSSSKIRILHSPSHLEGKGTLRIRSIIASLVEEGLPIDYLEISGRPNSEVLSELRNCDFVIDQLYSDTPMAGFATEAAFFGKPAIVGSYYARNISSELGAEHIPPSVFCHPDDIKHCIKRLVEDDKYRCELGEKAKTFVEDNWTVDKVALRYMKVINGDIPEDWFFDPRRSKYVFGCGMHERKARIIVRSILNHRGIAALLISDKPELENAFVRLSQSGDSD